MREQNRFCSGVGIQCPIIRASMAGMSTPALAAAVSNAGGLDYSSANHDETGSSRSRFYKFVSKLIKEAALLIVSHTTVEQGFSNRG